MNNMTPEQREKYILEFYPLAKRIVARICGKRGLQWGQIEDCCSDVTEEMIKAVDRYDESKKTKIKTFTTGRIRFAIKDYFRKLPGGRYKKGEYKDSRTQKGWELTRAFALNSAFPEDIDTLKNDFKYSGNGLEQKVCNKDLVQQIFQLLNVIDDKGKVSLWNARQDHSEIFHLYFIEEHTMQEIADMKSCTLSNISQIISGTTLKVKQHFNSLVDQEN